MGQIKVTKNVGGIQGLCIIEPAVHGDERGYFMETYNQKDMEEAGFHINFVQDNQSMSTKGVLRGLHSRNTIPSASWYGPYGAASLMWRWTLGLIPPPMANGTAWN